MHYTWSSPYSGASLEAHSFGLTWREECPNLPPDSTLAPVLTVSFILTPKVHYSSYEESLGHRIAKSVHILCERDTYVSHSLQRTYQTHFTIDEIKPCGGALNIISTIINISIGNKELHLRK